MIHHLSIPAYNPHHVAGVLAKVCHGKMVAFPSHPGSYLVLMLDEFGTAIEIYPFGTELLPGSAQKDVIFTHNAGSSTYSATHLALSVPSSQAEIEQIAIQEGWRAVVCSRNNCFNVIEFWVENKLLIELLTPEFSAQYKAFMQPDHLEQFLAAMAVATP